MDKLEVRREKLCLQFAKNCLKIDKLKQMFPLNVKDHDMTQRNCEKFKVNHAKTERYFQSSIPYQSVEIKFSSNISTASSNIYSDKFKLYSYLKSVYIKHVYASTFTPKQRLFYTVKLKP